MIRAAGDLSCVQFTIESVCRARAQSEEKVTVLLSFLHQQSCSEPHPVFSLLLSPAPPS